MYADLKITQLKNHPKNLRQEYADIKELADSVRAQGIRQPLLVVPEKDDGGNDIDDAYVVVAGNRRLKAAVEAGLGIVPCIVDFGMTEEEQLEVMLVENMQRKSLAPVEEAKGIQMMFDLGWDADKISEKTGLSSTTIYHRKKIAELDTDRIKGQATIGDFTALEKVKSLERRNALLDSIGSEDFERDVDRAVREEKMERLAEEYRRAFDGWAKVMETVDYSKYQHIRSYNNPGQVEKLEGDGFAAIISNYGWATLYREKDCIIEPEESDEERQRREELAKEAQKRREEEQRRKEIEGAAYIRRMEAFKYAKVDVPLAYAAGAVVELMLALEETWRINENIQEMFGEDIDSFSEELNTAADFARMGWCYLDGGRTFDYWGKFDCEWGGILMEFAKSMGIGFSEEDVAILDGTSGIYEEDE